MPIMHKSGRCVLAEFSPRDIVKKNECPYDVSGYFIVKGIE